MEDLFDEDNSAGSKKKPTPTQYQNQTYCYSNHAENIFSPLTCGVGLNMMATEFQKFMIVHFVPHVATDLCSRSEQNLDFIILGKDHKNSFSYNERNLKSV